MPLIRALAVTAAVLTAGIVPGGTSGADADVRSIPLHYDAALAGKGFPSPIARLSIDGRDAWFLIDTGAGVHTFAAWFVEAAGIPVHDSKAILRGSTGADTRVRVVNAVSASLDDGSALALHEAAVVDFPRIFSDEHIGGLLSPQLIARAGEAAVPDYRVPSLRFEPFAAAAAKLAGTPGIDGETRVCHNADSPFANRLFSVLVRAEGVGAHLLVDSGATRTIVASETRPLPARSTSARSPAIAPKASVAPCRTRDVSTGCAWSAAGCRRT